MIHCVIIDDEPLAIEIIETYLTQIRETRVIGKFTDPVDGFRFIQQNKVDLIFLDLNMPMLGGLDLLKNLKSQPAVIITTAYRDFAVESFELDVTDYLVKPFSFARFLKAVSKVKPESFMTEAGPANEADNRPPSTDTLWIKVDKKLVPVSAREIIYIQSLKDYIRIVTADQKLVTYHTLASILEKLPDNAFHRIHKSYIVQIDKVNCIEGNMVRLKNETLPIGRIYRKELLKATQLQEA
jgi:DNA-binding LytR/AlgR family response regulator